MIAAIVNQKGGVAKTTGYRLALHIARMGHNLLVIDADPLADTTFGFNIGRRHQNKSRTFGRSRTPVESVVMPDVFPGVDLIPSHIELSRSELQLVARLPAKTCFQECLLHQRPVRLRADRLPPSLGMLTVNALVACEACWYPTAAAPFAVKVWRCSLYQSSL